MMRAVAAALALGFALSGAALANPVTRDPSKIPAGTYVLDKRHASLTAKIPHMGGFSRYTLRFTGLSGEVTVDPAAWRTTRIVFTVDPRSADTGDASFNKAIAGFLGAERYPAIVFTSTGITGGETGEGQLAGDLTFNGVTRPVTLEVAFNGVGPGLLGAGTRMGFSGATRIKRSDFHATAVSNWAGDDVDLAFEIEFTRK
ncbi:MAG: polyisoprenoid-binding protein [Phenylobacterium sp.]|jgi:polyisoprenoid-binding protein YceI|nr:polyisoprenoid-binding protein [Phenylobacterium sp.]